MFLRQFFSSGFRGQQLRRGLRLLGRSLWISLFIPSLALFGQEQVKSFEVNSFRELLNPSEFGNFSRVFGAVARDYTAQGAPTPNTLFLENLEIIAGLDPANTGESSREFLFSFFKGFADGVHQPSEMGALVFDVESLPQGIGEMPVSGFVRRTGTVSSAPGSGLNSFYDGATGEIHYEGLKAMREATVSLSTTHDGDMTGQSQLSVFSTDQVQVGRWSGDLYSYTEPEFRNTLLRRVDQLYYGAMHRRDQPGQLNWFDRLGILALVDPEDADGDGIPDFSDTRVSLQPFFASAELGNQWYYAPWMRAAVLGTPQSWYLTTSHQWLYAPDAQRNGIWFYSPSSDLGWFWTREDLYPYVYRLADESFHYYHWEDKDGNRMVGEGEAFLYDFDNESWSPVRF